MPSYVIACANCGPQEFVARISEAAEYMPCPACERPRPQIFHPPQFVEDRVRFWTGVQGDRYSYALGEQMPETRQARDRLAREKGVEFCSKEELLADSKEAAQAVEYHAHVASGGARNDPAPVTAPDAWTAKPEWAKGLV